MIGLTTGEVGTVKTAIAEAFGAEARVWLFGSRAAGATRGDVDLYVETPSAVPGGLPAKLAARRRLEEALHIKVDLVVRAADEPRTAFDDIARSTGVPL
ncbi:MAG: nucleotidyltransferase family protein [Actinomycetota bacterium]